MRSPIVQTPRVPVRINPEKCVGCNTCVDKCPRHIIWSGETQGQYGLVIRRDNADKTKKSS